MNKLIRLFLKKKYTLSIGFFTVWMLFFDGNSAMFIYRQYNELKDLRLQESFLKQEIADMQEQRKNLFSTDDQLEKFAREQYFFKKDEENVYVIELED